MDQAIPDDFKTEYEKQRVERELRLQAGMSKKSVASRDNIRKAIAGMKIKRESKRLVEEKIKNGMPVTEEERELLLWSPGKKKPQGKDARNEMLVGMATKLLIRPQNVTELRVLVEQIAKKHDYNPIESLILQTQDKNLDEETKMTIHKALLPFLVPQIQTPRLRTVDDPEENQIKVTISQFVFPTGSNHAPSTALHLEAPATVQTTNEAPLAP
jgi:hypothetical protein